MDDDFVASESDSDVAEEYDENYTGGVGSSTEEEDKSLPKKRAKVTKAPSKVTKKPKS